MLSFSSSQPGFSAKTFFPLVMFTVCCWQLQVAAVVVTGLDGNTPESRLTVTGLPINGINHDGVGDLIVRTSANTFSRSTASLLWTGRHLLTTAHSVTDSSGVLNVSSTDDSFITFEHNSGNSTFTYRSSQISVHPGWNGNVTNGADLAIIDLNFIVDIPLPRYEIYTGPLDPVFDSAHTFFGYGLSGVGETGSTIASGDKRWGVNQYDGFSSEGILFYDFDDGTPERDAMPAVFGSQFADLGLGVTESATAPGDSGGPHFVEDPFQTGLFKIAGITSFGASIAETDVDTVTNSTYGELMGDAHLAAFSDWIYVTVPELPPLGMFLLAGLAYGGILFIRKFKKTA